MNTYMPYNADGNVHFLRDVDAKALLALFYLYVPGTISFQNGRICAIQRRRRFI